MSIIKKIYFLCPIVDSRFFKKFFESYLRPCISVEFSKNIALKFLEAFFKNNIF